jgi:hypothetical protein
MLNGEPVDFICNNCLLQQMPQIDIFDSKDFDNNITHNSTIIAHVTNVPEEKENIFEFPNLKGMHFIHVNARSILPKMSESWPKSPKLQSLQYQKHGLTLL